MLKKHDLHSTGEQTWKDRERFTEKRKEKNEGRRAAWRGKKEDEETISTRKMTDCKRVKNDRDGESLRDREMSARREKRERANDRERLTPSKTTYGGVP